MKTHQEPTTCLNQILGITKEIRENHKDNTHNFGEKHPRVPTRPKKVNTYFAHQRHVLKALAM